MRRALAVLCVVIAGGALLLGGRCGRPGESTGVEAGSRRPPAVAGPGGSPANAAAAPARGGPTTTTTTSTTSTVVSEVEGRGQPTPLSARHPIVAELPHDAPNFRVDYRAEGGVLVLRIRLRALQLRDPGTPSVDEQLVAYKAQALAWLAERGAGPATYRIEWDPARAGQL